MKKPEKISLASIGLIMAVLSATAFFASIVAYALYVYNMDLRTMFSPASSPAFNLMTLGYTVTFILAAIALLLAAITALRESQKPKVDGSSHDKKMMVNTLVISGAMLFAAAMSGGVPFYNAGEVKAETPKAEVVQLLKDDVGVTFGAYDEKAKAVPVTVTNKRPGATDYIIIIDALDRGGHRMAQDSIYTTDMEGRDTQTYKIFHAHYTKATPAQLESASFRINDITLIDRTEQ